jgi:hypothetical protein
MFNELFVRDRNWLEFLSVLDAVFSDFVVLSGEDDSDTIEARKKECIERIVKAREFFSHLVELDGAKERSGLLALLELEKRAKDHGLSTGRRIASLSFDIFMHLILMSQMMVYWYDQWNSTFKISATKPVATMTLSHISNLKAKIFCDGLLS